MPEAGGPTDSKAWMRSASTMPPPSESVLPPRQPGGPSNDTATSASSRPTSTSTLSRPTSTSASSTAFSAANLAAHAAEAGNGMVKPQLDGRGGGGGGNSGGHNGREVVKSSAEMLVAAAAQVALTIPQTVAGRQGMPYARGGGGGGGGGGDDSRERGFEGGTTGPPPPKLQQLTPRWTGESKLSSFSGSSSASDSGGSGSETESDEEYEGGRFGGRSEDGREEDYVFLRGKAAAAAVSLVQRSAHKNNPSGGGSESSWSLNSNLNSSTARQQEQEMAELMSNSVRELDNAIKTAIKASDFPPPSPAVEAGGNSSSNGRATNAIASAADADAAAPIYTADLTGAGEPPREEAEPETTPPVDKGPVAWEIKLTSPSTECATVHKEARGGAGRGGGGGGGTGNGVSEAGVAIAGEADGILSQRQQIQTPLPPLQQQQRNIQGAEEEIWPSPCGEGPAAITADGLSRLSLTRSRCVSSWSLKDRLWFMADCLVLGQHYNCVALQ